MTRLKELLACLALGLLCGVLGLAGYIGIKYIIPVAQNVRVASESLPQTMNSVKESADTANLVSTESLDLVGNANKLIDGLVVTNGKAGKLIDSGTSTVARLGGVADATTTRINALATAQAKAEAVMDTVSSLHINPVLDSLKTATDSISPAMNGLTSYVSGPLTFATNNAGELEDTLNLTVDQGRKRWIAPWDGTHPVKHRFGQIGSTGLQIVGVSSTVWRDTK